MTDHLVTRNLSQIREYTKNNIELSKSHHFLYNCLVDKKENQGDVIIIGLNPGETEKDFEYRGSLPTEESSEFDFHEEHGRGRSSKNWLTLCKKFSQTNKIVLTEFFFWSSPQVGEDKERGIPFSERFGYKFEDRYKSDIYRKPSPYDMFSGKPNFLDHNEFGFRGISPNQKFCYTEQVL